MNHFKGKTEQEVPLNQLFAMIKFSCCAMLIMGMFVSLDAKGKKKPKHRQKDIVLKTLDNGIISVGVDEKRGACIGYLALSSNKKNLLNHYDEGRFVQQSYYGKSDGSDWNGKPWVYNPVQGGSWDLKPSKIVEMNLNNDGSSLYTKTIPRHWASTNLCYDALMEQTISLEGHLVKVDFRFTYLGPDQGKSRHQEMPAVFVDGELSTFVYEKNGRLQKVSDVEILDEGKGNKDGLRYGVSSSHWFLWLNQDDHGVGIYTPGTEDFKVYRALGDGKTGPYGSACSYVAPLRTFSLKRGLTLEYTAYMTIGTLDEITERFDQISK
jgi:hypothetical protein